MVVACGVNGGLWCEDLAACGVNGGLWCEDLAACGGLWCGTQVVLAREHLSELWTELSSHNPSLARLDAIGSTMERSMKYGHGCGRRHGC